MEKETLTSITEQFANQHLKHIILSNPTDKQGIQKVKIRPLLLKGTLVFQAEEFTTKQAFHHNLTQTQLSEYLQMMLGGTFRQGEVSSMLGQATILVSKKGQMTIKSKRKTAISEVDATLHLEHNRKKQYLLKEGTPVPFLEDLGVMTAEGKVVNSQYDKFRQINRFLEFIEDILPKLDKEKESTILDFGCGKSYLTFAMYHYLHEVKGYPVNIIGLDLKEDVICHCNQLSVRYGFEKLHFYCGDIATYEGVTNVDMVVTLHACDTATDYALAKAIYWGAKVILSVPCCQHELNRQINNDLLQPVLHYGLIQERMAALYTDGLRAELLECVGYRTQILEFIDMEHTPKNILIRGIYDGKPGKNEESILRLMEFLQVQPTLYDLLKERIQKA